MTQFQNVALRCAVTRAISEEVGKPVEELKPETRLEELGIDSLEFVSLMMACGAAAGKDIPENKWQEMETVGDIFQVLAC